jgi:GDP-4-dehydro-6-deoxy-D-mannose reductase
MGTVSVLEYIVSVCPDARLLFISSGEVYGSSDDPMSEDAPINPYNPYGTTKATAEIAIRQFAGNYDLDTVISRSFPHFGPGQSEQFALPSFCRRIIAAGREGKGTIATGNLDPVRDYLYVTDVVRAYACLLSGGTRGSVYNVCSGSGSTMRSLVETLIRISGLELRIEVDRNLFRVTDISTQVGSPSRLLSLGWQQQSSLESGLTTLFEWWEARV